MNANACFQIGKDHIVCQDYALADVRAGLGYAIVCDGCSASPDVDFGARALAMSARRTLLLNDPNIIQNSEAFGFATIGNAHRVYDIFPYLHPQALDSTLLVTWVKDNQLTAYLYGDGVFVHRSATGVTSTHIQLSSGAPDYLSYSLDAARKESYDKLDNNNKEIDTESFGLCGNIVFVAPFTPIVITGEVQPGDVIAVISDGINSFRKPDNTSIPWRDLIDDFTLTGPATAGVFIQRRMNMFKRKCAKELYTHSDDISIAAIIV